MKRVILLICLIVLAIQTSRAQSARPGNIESDRPSKSETTKIVPVGFYLLETGIGFERDKVSGTVFNEYHFPEADLRIGMLDFLELRLHAEGLMRTAKKTEATEATKSIGVARTGVGMKARLWKDKKYIPEASFLANLTLPVGSQKFNHKAPEPEFRFIFFNRLTQDLTLNYTIGLEMMDARTTGLKNHKYDLKPEYAVCLNIEFDEKFFGFVEMYGEKFETKPFWHAADLGIGYKLYPNFQLDFSAGFGLSEDAAKLMLDAGLSVRLPR